MIGTAELERLYDWRSISSLTGAAGVPVGSGPLPVDSMMSRDFTGEAALDALQIILADAPLSDTLEMATLLVEEQTGGGFCSILLLDEDGVHLRYGAAPNLPESYKRAVDGLKVGPGMSVCGAAAYLREAVFVSDLVSDPRSTLNWESTLPAELRTYWAAPIISREDKVLGTFALIGRDGRKPVTTEVRAIQSVSRIAAIAIERHIANAKLRLAKAELEKAQAENELLKEQLHKDHVTIGHATIGHATIGPATIGPATVGPATVGNEVNQGPVFEEIVGSSEALRAVLSRVSKVAPTDSGVLITGETGTGKELIARAIHKRSQRAGKPFISVNCAALAPSLISSELFGHERGAFTGAMQRRLGRFEMADGGTIFLDEVGELPMDTQVALLRVLQEREFERVGGSKPIKVDVRVIAATNRNLEEALANGTFRSDLFYRLNVFPVEVPPLRQRKEDLLVLLEHFVQRFGKQLGRTFSKIDRSTLEMFQSYEWPGNIRELQNIVERSVIVSSGDVFCVDHAWLSTISTRPQAVNTPSATADEDSKHERQIIEAALADSRGRVSGPSGAAAKLGMPPSTLDFRIKKLNISKSRFKHVRVQA